ncbi:MAG: hypothetical protein NC182_01695 [Prevotella sp.]|nr:hypothetical protein [Staphylococcus sp.]MCM1349896.1 hypothetical protein [Prevotella sp.]
MSLQNIINIIVSVIYIITICTLWIKNKQLYDDNIQLQKLVKVQLKIMLYLDENENITKDKYYDIANSEFKFAVRKDE